MHWRKLASALLDIFAPPVCAACDAPIPAGSTFCKPCGTALEPLTRRLLGDHPLVVGGRYAQPLSTAIGRFKYEGRGELSRPLSRLLLPALGALSLPRSAVFVPVPLHAKRLAERGYNQAALLAQELAGALGHRALPRLLERTRDTGHQVGKSRVDRLTNARDAFALRQATASEVVLVDDVVTTGATVRACAQALAAGGIKLTAVAALADADGALAS